MRARLALTLLGAALLSTPGVAYGIAPPVQFRYTGGEQTYTVPAGVELVGVQLQGGAGGALNGPGGNGGDPGGVGALLPVFAGERLFVEVGQNGVYNGGATFGGGGAAGPPPPLVCENTNGSGPCGGDYAGSGGGASDLRTCSEHATSCPGGGRSIAARLLVGGGGAGAGGGGNSQTVECGAIGFGGNANNFQTLPGNPAAGPVPVITAAGIVYPAPPQTQGGTVAGVTPPGGGGASAGGAGGSQAGCSTSGGQESFSDSVPGSAGALGDGGTGGNASGLPPFSGNGCQSIENSCQDAGSGGGGGGGYFGGGGGATGLDKCTGQSGPCNAASSGQGGAGGSSFVSKVMLYPHNGYGAISATTAYVEIAPAIEIDVPANGAVYSPGQHVDASWSCVAVNGIVGTLAQNCTATDASGSPISTTPGRHTFTVKGINQTNSEPVSATVTYTVGTGSGKSNTSHASVAGLKFTLAVPSMCLAPGATLHITISRSGSGKTYRAISYALAVGGLRRKSKPAHKVSLALKGLSAGGHRLKLVVLLRRASGKTKTLTLGVPFTVC